ncbi:MAG TPA: hypothetical protein VKD72_19875 [Gemmataceae bacterium]|nr:hypothetical protein [Gemmataceae bacterium]
MTISHDVVLWCLLLAPGQVPDNPPKPDADKELKAARMEHMKKAAKSYEITLASDAAKKLVLTEEPYLRFDDQVTGVVDGTVFVWMLDGRPAATASVWIRKSGQEFHEFQSLATGALTATSDGQTKWAPAQAGVEFKPIPNAQPPAATAVGRLAQMRTFAREHRATVVDSVKDQIELRLLPQPVCRWGRADGAVVDGGLFAYCKGTNPEVLLLVEAIKNGKELEWHYVFTRMTSRGCEVRRDDKEVWKVPVLRGGSPTDIYFNVVFNYVGPGAKTEAPPKDK